MPLKVRLSLLYVGAFMLITAFMLMYIYFSYSHFRSEEFYDRLKHKAHTTAKLLLKVQEVDKALLKVIDRNTINELYDEKVLIFDTAKVLVYSSLDDEPIDYNNKLLDDIKREGYVEWKNKDGDEIIGLEYIENNAHYLVLASAFDKAGKRKLNNLFIKIVVAFALGAILIFISSFYYIKQVFKPIENLNSAINDITKSGLQKRVNINESATDELTAISRNFNSMMDQLEQAFILQDTFVQHTSHELKTPLSIIAADTEKLINKPGLPKDTIELLSNIRETTMAQAKMIDELLLIQKLKLNRKQGFKKVRVDELVLDEIEYNKQLHNFEFEAQVNFDASLIHEHILEQEINPVLFKTAVRNLLENAAFYSPDKKTAIDFAYHHHVLTIQFSNKGDKPLPNDLIFQPFYRHQADHKTKGYGLGLALTRQIMAYHNYEINYTWAKGEHHFIISMFSPA